jgi:restriction system protein
MSIPEYNKMMYPTLSFLSDGKVHTNSEINQYVSDILKISEVDRKEMLNSGKQTVFINRATWARTYLKKAGLILSPNKAEFQISTEGRKVLLSGVVEIDRKLLMQYDEFRKFQSRSNKPNAAQIALSLDEILNDSSTPQDIIENAMLEINTALESDLLAEVSKLEPTQFEQLVVDLLEKMGYGDSSMKSGYVTKKTGDEGIDGIVKDDKLGFDTIYIQAKKWDISSTVSRPEVQKFIGALAGVGANKGLFVTTAKFSDGSYECVAKSHTAKVILIDGIKLSKLMIEYGLGVSIESTFHIKRIDSDYFEAY